MSIMKWSFILLVFYFGTSYALPLLFPVEAIVEEKCSEEYKHIQTDIADCTSSVLREAAFDPTDIEEHIRHGTLSKLLQSYHIMAQRYYKCLEPVNILGRKCLSEEDKVYVDRSEVLYKQIMDYVFGNNAQKTIDFIKGGGYDCVMELDLTKCQETKKATPEDILSVYKYIKAEETCSLNFIQEKCPNVRSYVSNIYDMFKSAFHGSSDTNREKSEIQLSNFSEMGKRAILSLLVLRGRRRTTRDLGGLNNKLPHIEKTFKDQCKKDLNKLEPAIESMKACLDTKPVFVTPRDEYLQQLDTCTTETRDILKKCLLPKYRFFPDLLLHIAQAVVRLVYDDSGEIIRGLGPCLSKLRGDASQMDYLNCMSRVNSKFDDKFPDSKEEFCSEFIEVSECFVKQINDTCTANVDLSKFTHDYMEALKNPCKS